MPKQSGNKVRWPVLISGFDAMTAPRTRLARARISLRIHRIWSGQSESNRTVEGLEGPALNPSA